jgi:putative ABC transport system permease protein
MGSLLRDLRYSCRLFLQNPGFIAVAVLSLALGIGANTTIFSVFNVLILRPLPFKDSQQLVMLDEINPKDNDERNLKLSTVLEWRQHSRCFEQVEAATLGTEPGTMTGAGEAERVRLQHVSPGVFVLLGVKPTLGRGFLPEDTLSGSGTTIIISHGLWQRRFGGNSNILGQTVIVQSQAQTIIGVMSPGFWVFPWAKDVDVWMALNLTNNQMTPDTRWLSMLARLKPGTTVGQARAEVDVFSRHQEQADPAADRGWQESVEQMQKWLFQGWKEDLYLMLGAVGFVLLIACANVANLLLARATTREKEIAIRLSLGVGRSRLLQQLLTESVLLALLGGVLGMVLAIGGIRVFAALSDWFPRGEEIRIDGRVLIFTLGISLLTGILFGLVPSLQASKPYLIESLKEGGSRSTGEARHLGRSLLVISEVALASILLVGAGLMINSLLRLKAVSPGFNSKNLLTATIELTDRKYREMLEGDKKRVTPAVDTFHQQIVDGLQTVPGVESVASASSFLRPTSFRVMGRAEPPAGQRPEASFAEVSPGYFHTLQIPLLKGRLLTEQDDERAPWVIVVNEAMARLHFAGEDPIGKTLHLKLADLSEQSVEEDRPRVIVGVVGSVKHWGLSAAAPPAMYVSHRQHVWVFPGGTSMSHLFRNLLVRASSNPMNFASVLRQVVAQADKTQVVFNIMTMEQSLSEGLAYRRFYMQLFGIFGGLAVVLAVVGIYGVMSYSVARRTHEVGIRMATGAQRRHILKLVVGHGLKLALIGVAIGIGGSLALTRLLAQYLYEVKPTDPLTLVAVAIVLTAVALGASYIPARRAMKVDPVVALRYE